MIYPSSQKTPPRMRGHGIWRPLEWACGVLAVGLLSCGLFAMPSVTADSVGRPWADRPLTLDPTYGLRKPSSAVRPVGAIPAWIWASQTRDNQTIYLRQSFNLKTAPQKVILYATADDHLQLFLNGRLVTSTFNKYNSVWQRSRKLSIASLLRVGGNTIAIRAKNDAGAAGVVIWMLAGHKTLEVSNGSWRVASHVPSGMTWIRRRFNDSTWAHATVETPYGGEPWGRQVRPWPSASYMAHLYFQPLHVTVLHGRNAFKGLSSVAMALTEEDIAKLRPGYAGRSLLAPSHAVRLVVTGSDSKPHPELLISFGQEVAGRIQVRGSGGTVLVGTGESRGEALHRPFDLQMYFHRLNRSTQSANKPWRGYVNKLNLVGGHTQSTPYSAFRYATVSFSGPGPIHLNRLRLDFKYYPVKYRGAFACSDPLLTKIWYTGAYTAHLCMQEQIWDAPKRDRLMWMGDLQVSGQVINNVFLDRPLMELTMRDLRAQAQGVRPPTALPISYINPTHFGSIPGYSNAWFCGLADFYRHTGAIGYIRSQHQLMLSMLKYIKQGFNRKNIFVNKNHGWCFVDWAYHLGMGNAPQAIIATDLDTCWAVRRAVFLLNAIGDTANAQKYARWDRQITLAARKNLADPKTHTFTNLRQVNAMAVISHVADARQRAAIYARILGPDCPSWQQTVTPYYNNFVMFSLARLGHFNQALNFIRFFWGGMIRRGATTFWEEYNPAWPIKDFHKAAHYNTSLCHGWSAGVTSWLTECVLGVQPRTGGFARVSIVPHLGGLKWASGRVPTPRGNIVLHVDRTRSTTESLTLTLPPGVGALVGVVGRSVTVNGTVVRPVRRGDRRCYITLSNGGRYHILGHK